MRHIKQESLLSQLFVTKETEEQERERRNRTLNFGTFKLPQIGFNESRDTSCILITVYVLEE
jgi:hypothetical protein